jgi:hypothetical protein
VVQFHVSAPKTSIGMCQDALQAECVNDLLALATNSTARLSSGSTDETYVCSQLHSVLQSNMPPSCLSKGLAGEAIVAKGLTVPFDLIPMRSLTTLRAELTGPGSSLLPVQQNNCNISTGGQAYNIALVESEFFRSDTYTSHVSAYIFGIAPVLTVFYPNIAPNSTLLLGQAETHLTCLKIVEPGASDSYPGLLNAASSFSKPRVWRMVSAWFLMVQFWF